jgi:molybdate transport system substrate-binding protein
MKRFGVCCTAVLTLLCLRALADDAPPAASPAGQYKAREALYPPWQGGENDDATDKGFNFTVPPVDVMVDFHGSVDNPALVLYASGNYYFAMKDLVAAFEKANPTYLGKVFYETLPPGILLKQMAAHGTVTAGNLTFTVPADIFMAEERASKKFVTEGRLVDPVVSFEINDLTIMVPAGNPAHIIARRRCF